MYNRGNIKVGALNIQGGFDKKSKLVEFVNIVNMFDVCVISESKLHKFDSINIKGYSSFRSDRVKGKPTSRCNSGGIVVLFKNEIIKGITKLTSNNPDIIWIKLSKKFFGLQNDWLVCTTYIVPSNSPYYKINKDKNVMDVLQEEIEKYSTEGEVIIIGDLNSRTGQIQEHTHTLIECDTSVINTCSYNDSSDIGIRSNKDNVINQNGRKLINIVNENDLIIVNGRTPGDFRGEHTHIDAKGNLSVLDLCIVTNNLYKNISYFNVLDFEWFSDHAPVQVILRTDASYWIKTNNYNNYQKYDKYIWNDESSTLFAETLQNENYRNELKYIKENASDPNSINALTKLFNNVAEKCLKKTSQKKKSNAKGINTLKMYKWLNVNSKKPVAN